MKHCKLVGITCLLILLSCLRHVKNEDVALTLKKNLKGIQALFVTK